MAAEQWNEEKYSTLELVRDDKTAHAPEKDWAVLAPERNRPATSLAPELVIAHGIQLPEAVPESSNESHEAASPTARRPSRKLFWKIVIIVTSIFICSLIGLGIGLGLHHDRDSHNAQSASPSSTPPPLPSSTSISTAHAILNDTSFSVASTPKGDRHVFFQENSGAIRECFFNISTATWSVSAANIVATDAKMFSPLTSFHLAQNTSRQGFEEIYLFYISANNSIAFKSLEVGQETWSRNPAMYPNISTNVAAAGSRALVASYVSDHGLFNNYTLHLLYEGVQGNATWTIGSYATPSNTSTDLLFDWSPVDMIPPAPGQTPLRNFSGPFILDFFYNDQGNVVGLSATYVSYFQDTFRIEATYHDDTANETIGNGTVGFETSLSSLDLHEMDISQNWLCIKNMTLETIDGYNPYKLDYVPYRRLNSNRGLSGQNLVHVYRQLDQTTLAEHVNDQDAGTWSSSNITIST